MNLAIYNFGIHVAAYGEPAIAGFMSREPLNFEAATKSAGFVGRSGYAGDPGPESWGEQVFPRFLREHGQERGPSSLSVWHDIETLMAYSYNGIHAEALKHARHWNVPQAWPALVLWWIDDQHIPDWSEAVERFEYLHDQGPSARAFNFKHPYAPDGTVAVIDRARIKDLARLNAAAQEDLLATAKRLPV
jgi:hypothetical protein